MDENPRLRALERFHQPSAAARVDGIFSRADKPVSFAGLTANATSVLEATKPLMASSCMPEVSRMVEAVAPLAARSLPASMRSPVYDPQKAHDLYQYGMGERAVGAGPSSFQRALDSISGRAVSPDVGRAVQEAAQTVSKSWGAWSIRELSAGLFDQMPSVARMLGLEDRRRSKAVQQAISDASVMSRDFPFLAGNSFADSLSSGPPLVGGAGLATAFDGLIERAGRQTAPAARLTSVSDADFASLMAKRIAGASRSQARIGPWDFTGLTPAAAPAAFRSAGGFQHSPSHPRQFPRWPALASFLDVIGPPQTFQGYEPPVFASALRIPAPSTVETDAGELDVIEYADPREDIETEQHPQVAVEELLDDLCLDEELDHLRGIPDLLAEGGHKRVLAASSASIVFQHLADAVEPPRKGEVWYDLRDRSYKLNPNSYANRLVAFVGVQLADEMTASEFIEFDATVNEVKEWLGRGHHIPVSDEVGEYTYRRYLWVLGFVGRAHWKLHL